MKKTHRLLGAILVLMLMFCFSAVAWADEATPWDGATDFSWYNTTDTSFEIKDGKELAGLAAIVNGTADGIAKDDFVGKTVKLIANIDLGSQAFTPIGSSIISRFNGVFDGNGKEITNLTIAKASANAALFGYNGNMVKNLVLASGDLTDATGNYRAALVARNYGPVLNCVNKISVTGSGTYIGGLVAYNSGYIIGCANLGDVATTASSYAGGICAQHAGGSIASCYNTGDISCALASGGIAGTASNLKISDSYSSGAVGGGNLIGGIIGNTNANWGNSPISNNYYLQTETINSGVGPVGVAPGATPPVVAESQVKALNEATLKDSAATLGADFAADDGASLNNGYPVLAYQKTGVYPPEESQGLEVTGLSETNNGYLIMTLNKTLTYTSLQPEDFTVTITPAGGSASDVENYYVYTYGDEAVAELYFEPVPNGSKDESYTVTVQYKGGQVYSGDFAVPGVYLEDIVSFDNPTLDFGKLFKGQQAYTNTPGSLTVSLNDTPVGWPEIRDFQGSYVAEVNGEFETNELKFTNISMSGNEATLSFERIPLTSENQDIIVRVSYKGGARKTLNATLPAARNWSEYVKKPAIGDGSPDSPYQIASAEELAWFAALTNGKLKDGTAQNLQAHAKLIDNIELNDVTNWESWGKDTEGIRIWEPIGHRNSSPSASYAYQGVFDGQGYTVSGMYVAWEGTSSGNIMGFVSVLGGTVKNLKIEKSYVYTVGAYAGGISGRGYGVTIQNCGTDMVIEAEYYSTYGGSEIGGISGRVENVTGKPCLISDCYSSSILKGMGQKDIVAGIVTTLAPDYYTNSGSVRNCYFSGSATTTGNGMACGIIGSNTVSVGSNLTDEDGNYIREDDAVVAACTYTYTLENCYSVGAVTAANQDNAAAITPPAAALPADNMWTHYRLLGEASDYYSNNYFKAAEGVSDPYGISKTEEELKAGGMPGLLGDSYTTLAGVNDGYPALKWQGEEPGDLTAVAVPLFTLSKGGFYNHIMVEMSCATEGAVIYYTTDGSTPTVRNGEEYTGGPVALEGVIKAVAYKDGMYLSAVNSVAAETVVAPVFSPAGKTLNGDTKIAITCALEDAVIYYTTDGSEPIIFGADRNMPNISTKKYTGKFTVDSAATLKAVAVAPGMLMSPVVTETYDFTWSDRAFEPEQDSDGVYLLGCAQELAWFGALVNGSLEGVSQDTGAKARLIRDIDMGAYVWTPMANFTGVLDGANHSVKNLYFGNDNTENNNEAKGFVRNNSGTVKNLTFTGQGVDLAVGSVGMVAVLNSGTISNCHNEVDICTFGRPIGGIAASNFGTIEFCSNSGVIAGTKLAYVTNGMLTNSQSQYIGGIVGQNSGLIRDCYNTGKITSAPDIGYYMGQIAGEARDGSTIQRCYALGKLAHSGYRVTGAGDWGGWSGINPYNGGPVGGYCGLLAGGINGTEDIGASAANVNDSFFIPDLTIAGEDLEAVKLGNDNFKAAFFELSYEAWGSIVNNYGFAGRQVGNDAASLLNKDAEHHVFYDVTNDKYLVLELSGEGEGDSAVIDATDESAPHFTGSAGNYLTGYYGEYYLYKVPAATKSVKFINTEKLQDYSTEADLTEFRAAAIEANNIEAVLEQVNSTWPDRYDAIAAALKYVDTAVEEEEPITGKVRVIIENTTFTDASQSADGNTEPPWSGTLVDTEIELDETTTMMSAIVDAAAKGGVNGETVTIDGVEQNYITDINGLGAFGGKGAQSGWMGTINDWFTNAGFTAFTAQSGNLRDGMVIRVMYTNADNGGTDLGGSIEGDTNTKLKALSFTNATLTPEFDGATTEYTLTMDEGETNTAISFTAANKVFQARAYVGEFQPSKWGYASGEVLNVQAGDTIYVGVGNRNWPSMQEGAEETRYVITVAGATEPPTPTEYTVTFDSQGGSDVAEQVVNSNAKVVKPQDPTKDGYIFDGWYREAACETSWNFDLDVVTANMTLYAKWDEEPVAKPYGEALAAAQNYIKAEVPEANVGSTKGEWAVIALARSNAASQEWSDEYLANLKEYVAAKDGKLSSNKYQYTEYSRVTLAVTALGLDATAIATGNDKVYDIVSPLTTKDDSGKYYPQHQGNNSIAFALIALDSANYLPEAKNVRADYIDALIANQLEDGSWPISVTGQTGNVDTTAMVVQSLAPYYKDRDKFAALGADSTYEQLQAAVDKALVGLKGKADANGDYGSVETASQILVALCSLGIDPEADGWQIVTNVLGYQIANGGFKHTQSAANANQMATEQASYALVAYDRFVKDENTLYDMTDVFTFTSPAAAVIEAINALPAEITLANKDEVEQAREAYDQLTEAEKTLVNADTLQKLTDAEAVIVALEGGGEIEVSFRLIGDSLHEDGVADHDKYITWIPTKTYSFEADKVTVYDVFTKALTEAGLAQEGADKNYVSGIKAPEILGGYWLEEFTNGPNSGWMYTVNGEHPLVGLKNCQLKNGDVIIWHYVDDYTLESAFDGEEEPQYLNRWLEAEDIAVEITGTRMLINALPGAEDITLNNKEAVNKARAAYDALNAEQKALIDAAILKKLTDAEARIAELEEDEPQPDDPIIDVAVMSDVSAQDWFYEDVAYVLAKGIMKGASETTFEPKSNITRGQFVTILGRWAGVTDAAADNPSDTMFSDVEPDKYYASHVAWAVEKGITQGTSSSSFEPKANITREDMATMIARYAKVMAIDLPVGDNELFADDSEIRDYAKEAVYSMKAAGILSGKGDNNFAPRDFATRAEAAKIIHKLAEL